MGQDETVALGDLAEQLGISSEVLLQEINAGELEAVKVDGRLRVPREAAVERLSRRPASPPSASR